METNHNDNAIDLPGRYIHADGLYLFKLRVTELERLAQSLLGAAARRETVTMRVESGVLRIRVTPEAGFTLAGEGDNAATVETDADCLHELAELVQQMSHDHNVDHFAHTHLEVFLTATPTGGASDVVIERLGDTA